eukprot:GHVL01007201.1.p1 GENE.GHVL01007201.1~~GHVL01007201.1.p1  ORF type:complete len:276 (+),score=47.97 GHVL01007201.1:632-1459(+)
MATNLSEQLRLVLEPTLRGRLQGDYRTGKRINMRKIVPFIASNYRRDKIWLRRTKNSKRQYQVLLAMDNSLSMSECGIGQLAIHAITAICQALVRVEVGQFGVVVFGGETPRVVTPLSNDFNSKMGTQMMKEFTFADETVNSHNRGLSDMLQMCIHIFEEARLRGEPLTALSQMLLIISDGRFNKNSAKRWVHEAISKQLLPVMIAIESPPTSDKSPSKSLLDLKTVSYTDESPSVKPYLDDFPFPFYIIVNNLEKIPTVLCDIIRQWFELNTSF